VRIDGPVALRSGKSLGTLWSWQGADHRVVRANRACAYPPPIELLPEDVLVAAGYPRLRLQQAGAVSDGVPDLGLSGEL